MRSVCLFSARLRPLPGSGAVWGNSGGVARASLNPRLMAGIPPGSGMTGGDVGGVTEPVWGNSGWRGFPGSVSPATTEGAHRAQGVAGDNWPVPLFAAPG